MGYIKVPIETNPETLAQDIFNYIKSQQPNWTPNDGNLDTWIIRAVAAKAAENRTLASDVPDTIYQSLGSSLLAIPPIDAQPATGNTTWTLGDTAGHTIPAGTFLGIRDSNGNLVPFQTVLDVIVAPGSSTTAAGEVVIEAVDVGTDANALNAVPELIDVLDWVTSIALVSPTGGGVEAEIEDEYLNRLTRKLQGLSTVPILPHDFANAALDADPGVYRAVGLDLYNPLHNLLTADEASVETGVSAYGGSSATLAQSAAQAADGTKSISITSTANGAIAAILNNGNAKAASPGQKITASAFFRAAATPRNCSIGIRFLDNANTNLQETYGSNVANTTSGFTQAIHSAVAPAGTTKVIFIARVSATVSTEVHYADKMLLRHGVGTDWVSGGMPETNNIRTVTVAAVDIDGNAVSTPIKDAIASYILARREQNWIVHVVDPRYTNIDVATNIKILPGYDSATVELSVEAALTDYLSASNWGQDPNVSGSDAAQTWVEQPVVYYNELIALVSSVTGVDRVSDLTVNIHGFTPARVDVAIDSPAGLTTPGTIAATAV